MRSWERWAATLSFVAGGIHAVAGPGHVEEWWLYGLFFVGAAAAQVGYGLVVLTQGIEGWGGWMAVRRKVYAIGAWMTAAIIAFWAVSRTVGVPVGPQAFEPEGLGFLDAASKAVELALLAVLVRLWRSARPAPAAPGGA